MDYYSKSGNSPAPLILVRCKEAHELVSAFLAGSIADSHLDSLQPRYIVQPQRRETVKEKVRKSMEVLEKALDSHSLEELAVSYNGGKDCLVMLTLLLAAVHKKLLASGTKAQETYKLDSIYINSELPFTELSEFIAQSNIHYLLNLVTIKSSLKDGFEHYLQNINRKTKAIVVGIRYADPYGSLLQYEQETDHNWPKFVRIHPILHWNYCEIWDFIMACDLRYCTLYDQGYTSLGGVDTTLRNVYLKQDGSDSYYPAYMLEEDADARERVGRVKKQ